MQKKSTVVVFSGFNQRAVVSFLRVLEEQKIDYAIVAKSADDPVFLTSYSKNIVSVRHTSSLDLEDFLTQIENVKKARQTETCFIAPSAEALNRFLLQHRILLEKTGCIIPIVEEQLYNSVSDKYSFGMLCSKNGITIPKEYDKGAIVKPPVVAKPRTYFSGSQKNVFTPVLIYSDEELNKFEKEHEQDDFYFQEFVQGESFYLLYYFDQHGEVTKCSQQNFVQQAGGKSMIACLSSDYHRSGESDKYETLFKKLNFRGLVMIEEKKNSGGACMIEANPRFWGPSQLFIDAGVNLFLSFLCDFGIIKDNRSQGSWKVNTRYFWFGGLVENLRNRSVPAYGNYTAQELTNELPLWLSADVYRKGDTEKLFYNELS